MSLTVTITIERGATVLRLRGTVDPAEVAARRSTLAAAAADAPLVIVDLDDTTAVAAQAVRDLLNSLGDPVRVHVVARRRSMVSLLAQSRIHHVFAVHRSITDAIAAHQATTSGR